MRRPTKSKKFDSVVRRNRMSDVICQISYKILTELCQIAYNFLCPSPALPDFSTGAPSIVMSSREMSICFEALHLLISIHLAPNMHTAWFGARCVHEKGELLARFPGAIIEKWYVKSHTIF